MSMPSLNLELLRIVQRHARRNHASVLLIGGAVRDALKHKPQHDYDFGVLGDTVRVARAVANDVNGDFYVMDTMRGTVRVLLPAVDEVRTVLDFAACRGATFDEDLRARDFTLNAIALELERLPDSGEIEAIDALLYDPLLGAQDLNDGILRLCGPNSINDDPLRALRAVRMVAQHIVMFTTETLLAVRSARLDRSDISHERLRDELFKMLGNRDARALMLRLAHLQDGGPTLLAQVLPEAAPHVHGFFPPGTPVDGDATPHADQLRAALAQISGDERNHAQVLAFALLHHPACSSTQAGRIASRLRLTVDETKLVRATLNGFDTLCGLNAMPEGTARQRATHDWLNSTGEHTPLVIWAALRCLPVNARGPDAGLHALLRRYYTVYAPDVASAPLINGEDLIALGIPPGPALGRTLADVRFAQLQGELRNRDAALDFATKK